MLAWRGEWQSLSRYVPSPVGQGTEKGLESSSALAEQLQKNEEEDDGIIIIIIINNNYNDIILFSHVCTAHLFSGDFPSPRAVREI